MRQEDQVAETYMENYDYLPPVEAVQAVAQDVGVDEHEVVEVLKRRIGLDFSRTKFENVGKYSSNSKNSNMSKNLFNNLVKLGNNNPDLRGDIRPVLHHLKKNAARNKQSWIMEHYTAKDCLMAAAQRFDGSKGEFLSLAGEIWEKEN